MLATTFDGELGGRRKGGRGKGEGGFIGFLFWVSCLKSTHSLFSPHIQIRKYLCMGVRERREVGGERRGESV